MNNSSDSSSYQIIKPVGAPLPQNAELTAIANQIRNIKFALAKSALEHSGAWFSL